MTLNSLKKWFVAIAVVVGVVAAGAQTAGADGSSWYGEPPPVLR